jgi:histidyl-tRNA synthetase
MPLRKKPLNGMRQLYPREKRVEDYVVDAVRSAGSGYGYEEYEGPVIEPLDLFLAKSGNELALEQSYNFEDRKGRRLILRPELTPTLARMVAAAGELVWPVRWMSFPVCYRYERPQRGRAREFMQFNCDLLGVPGPEAELELMLVLDRIMTSLGAGPSIYRIAYSSRKLAGAVLEDAGLGPELRQAAFHAIDRREKMDDDDWREYLADRLEGPGQVEAARRLADCRDIDDPWLREVAGGTEAYGRVRWLGDRLSALGTESARFDGSVVRGLDYYTGIVFEVMDTGGRNRRAICGGGRYDDLVGLFGGRKVPGAGFGLGMLTLRLFLDSYGLIPDEVEDEPPARLFLAVYSPDQRDAATVLSERLRDAGVAVETDIGGKSLSAQFRLAGIRGIPYTAVLGPEEAESGRITLKDMRSGSQTEVPFEHLAERIDTED